MSLSSLTQMHKSFYWGTKPECGIVSALANGWTALTLGEGELSNRTFLFLQGISTPMFFALGRRLSAAGGQVHRIHICTGDGLFWPFWKADSFRGPFTKWAEFISQYLETREVTDIIMFGDCRPYHRVALSRALRRGVRVHVFDEGLVRPHWVTMTSAGSEWRNGSCRAATPNEVHDVAGGLTNRVAWDVAFHCVNTVLSPLYPFYRRHRPGHPLEEAKGWLKRLAKRGKARRDAEEAVMHLQRTRQLYFLIPLQLDSDSQIRFRSRFANMGDMLSMVMASFSVCAPADTLLVVKAHPLDNGIINRAEQIKKLAHRYGIENRVIGLDGGDLDTLLASAQGTVVINSTVGLTSIRKGCPTKVLGSAIYEGPGLSSQLTLDDFWRQPDRPDPETVERLVANMMAGTQINGSFFTKHGMALANEGIVKRLSKGSDIT